MPRRIGLALALTAVGITTAWLLWPRAAAPRTPDTWTMRFEPGTLYRYHLDYASAQDVTPFVDLDTQGAELQSDTRYVGEVHLRALGEPDADGNWSVGLRLAACESAAVTVSDQALLDESASCDALLSPHELVVELDARGRPGEVREPDDAPEVFGYLAAYLASELAVTWPDSDPRAWQVSEVDMLGSADSAYRAVGSDPARLHVERERAHYSQLDAAALLKNAWEQKVQGRHKLTLHRDGYLEELMGAESVVATSKGKVFLRSNVRFRLRLLERRDDDSAPPPVASYAARALKQARPGPDSTQRLLRDRIGDLTREQALSLLRRFAGSGRVPDHNRFLWQMTALLRLHPELARELESIFRAGNSKARGLVLDLLAGAGTPEAQAVMRELLETNEAGTDPTRHLLSQRIGILEHPDEQTVAFARDRFTDTASSPSLDDHHSAAYTLGAVAGHADDATRAELRGLLVAELNRSRDPASTAHAINALANAKDPADASRFASYAEDDDGDVRLAAAAALGRPATEVGRATLLEMVADADRGVQKQAIRSLRHHALTDADFEALAGIVADGGLHHTNARPLLELAKIFRRELPTGTGHLIEAMIAAGIQDNKVLAAAHRLLRGEPVP